MSIQITAKTSEDKKLFIFIIESPIELTTQTVVESFQVWYEGLENADPTQTKDDRSTNTAT